MFSSVRPIQTNAGSKLTTQAGEMHLDEDIAVLFNFGDGHVVHGNPVHLFQDDRFHGGR